MLFGLDSTQVLVAGIGGFFGFLGVAITGWFGYKGIIGHLKAEGANISSGVNQVQATVTNGLHDAMNRMEVMVADISATVKVSTAMDDRPMFRTTAHGGLVWANEAACQLLGMTLETLQQDGWARAVHPDDAHNVFSSWQNAVSTKEPWGPATYRYLHPTTRKVTWVRAVAQPVIHKGELVSWVATVIVIEPPISSEES